MTINGSDWYDEYTVSMKHGSPLGNSRMRILEGGTLLFVDKDDHTSAAAAAGLAPHTWTYITMRPGISRSADGRLHDQRLQSARDDNTVGMNGSDWFENVYIVWAENWWQRDDDHKRPDDQAHRMRILSGGMLLFENKIDGELMLVAPGTWTRVKGPFGDPTG
jgi:hypothetical protein